jgi:DNA processing protein
VNERPAEALCAAALAGLPGTGPAVLAAILADSTPAQAWRRVLEGEIVRPSRKPPAGLVPLPLAGAARGPGQEGEGDPGGSRDGGDDGAGDGEGWQAWDRRRSWQAEARRTDLGSVGRRLEAGGIGVTWPGEAHYPAALASDPEPPGVLFWRGDLSALERPCVAVVGTRHCSPDGRQVAFELGRDLADGGVCVVSGLALGIDGAAHRGALASGGAPMAGVAASGVDVPYPRQHAELWQQVASLGTLVSETAPGRPAQAWRFPARNRVIAGLVHLVVVVESHEAGGSMLTVDAALARGVDVCAVPGPVHSPASAGTNRLLLDGAAPVRHAGDVFDGLGLTTPAPGAPAVQTGSAGGGPSGRGATRLVGLERETYDAVGWAPTGLAKIVDRVGADLGATSGALARLEELGLIDGGGSWWVRRSRRR